MAIYSQAILFPDCDARGFFPQNKTTDAMSCSSETCLEKDASSEDPSITSNEPLPKQQDLDALEHKAADDSLATRCLQGGSGAAQG